MTHRRVRRSRRWLRLGRESLLTVGAVLGLVCLVASAVGIALDVRPVIFRSGSMSPAIETGALALSRTTPASELAVGDVVTVTDSKGILVTHRIRSITRDGDDATLILQGDDNPVADPEPYVVQSVDRVFVDVPRLGYVVSAAAGPYGVFAGGLLVGLVLTTVFSRRRKDDDSGDGAGSSSEPAMPVVPDTIAELDPAPAPSGAGRRAPGGRRRLVLVAVVVAGAVSLIGTTSTTAAWTDTASVATGQFTMRAAPAPVTPAAPVLNSCVRSGSAITLTWSVVAGATGYSVVYTAPNGTQAVVGATSPTPTTLSYTTANVNFNNQTGTISVRASNAAGTSAASNAFAYTGNGSANAVCTAV